MLNQEALDRISGGGDTTPNHRYILPRLRDDYERWQFCIAMAEHYRSMWALQCEWHARHIEFSDQKRYKHMNREARRTAGSVMWSKSAVARDYEDMENKFRRWAGAYAAAHELRKAVNRRVPQPRVSATPR